MRFAFLTTILIVIIAVVACDNGGGEYITTESGLKYKYYEKNDGETPKTGDIVTLQMNFGPKDSVLFTTDKTQEKRARFPLRPSDFSGDIYEGIGMMSIGDSASFIISADSFFLITARSPQLPPFIQSGSDLYFELRLVNFQTKEEFDKAEAERMAKLSEEAAAKLRSYVEEHGIKDNLTQGGIYYMEEKPGTGDVVKNGEMTTINYAVYDLDGKMFFSSFGKDRPVHVEIGQQFDTPGFMEGLKMMRRGSKARLVVPAIMAFGEKGRGGTIPPYTSLVYDVEVLSVMDQEVFQKQQEEERKQAVMERQKKLEELKKEEIAKINHYLRDNVIKTKPTESGLYYMEEKAGEGIQPRAGDVVKVHYTLYRLSGRKLQSSKESGSPFEFTLGRGEVIEGWDEGIAMMKEGGTAKLLIPSKIAYKDSERGEDIPPYTPLLFEVELLEVKPQSN